MRPALQRGNRLKPVELTRPGRHSLLEVRGPQTVPARDARVEPGCVGGHGMKGTPRSELRARASRRAEAVRENVLQHV